MTIKQPQYREGPEATKSFEVLTDGSPEAQHMAAELERIHALEDAR